MDVPAVLREYPPAAVIGLGLAGVVAGLVVVGCGQVYGALREIALNTREVADAAAHTRDSSSSYAGLAFIALLIELAGWLVVGGSVLVPAFVLLGGQGR